MNKLLVVLTRSSILGIVIIAICLTSCDLFSKDIYVTDVKEYSNIGYTQSCSVFPKEIPSNSSVVNFSYYYEAPHGECYDVYLELKFQTTDELEKHITTILAQIEAENREDPTQFYAHDGNLYHSECNPYNSDYTDVFSTETLVWTGDQYFVGYSVSPEDHKEYQAHYAIVSYSLEDLTVIHTVAVGRSKASQHSLKYLERFNITEEQATERWIYLEEKPEQE